VYTIYKIIPIKRFKNIDKLDTCRYNNELYARFAVGIEHEEDFAQARVSNYELVNTDEDIHYYYTDI
jgi:hypothetical protein